jgi:DNA mismatch repair protein MutS2
MPKKTTFAALEIDLHALRVEEAIRALERALDRAITEGYSEVSVVHGIGSGAIKEAVKNYLATTEYPILRIEPDPFNPGRTRVFI